MTTTSSSVICIIALQTTVSYPVTGPLVSPDFTPSVTWLHCTVLVGGLPLVAELCQSGKLAAYQVGCFVSQLLLAVTPHSLANVWPFSQQSRDCRLGLCAVSSPVTWPQLGHMTRHLIPCTTCRDWCSGLYSGSLASPSCVLIGKWSSLRNDRLKTHEGRYSVSLDCSFSLPVLLLAPSCSFLLLLALSCSFLLSVQCSAPWVSSTGH